MWILGMCYGAHPEPVHVPRQNSEQVCLRSASGDIPENFLKFPEIMATDTIRNTQAIPYTLRIHPGDVLKTTQLCKVTAGYRQLTTYSKY